MECSEIADHQQEPCTDCVSKDNEIENLKRQYEKKIKEATERIEKEERQNTIFASAIERKEEEIKKLRSEMQALKEENEERSKKAARTNSEVTQSATCGNSIVIQAMLSSIEGRKQVF